MINDKVEKRAREISEILKKLYPEVKIALNFKMPIQLLVATILSAQCTDKRVNMVTESLFKKYKTAADFAEADRAKFEQEIRSTGFYRNKAKNIISAAKIIVEKFNGKVPDTMEGLLQLPGAARKTANVVLWSAFKKNEGIAVDTHVIRLSQQLGLTHEKDPKKIERDLMKLIPRKEWGNFSLRMILAGRNICPARVKCNLEILKNTPSRLGGTQALEISCREATPHMAMPKNKNSSIENRHQFVVQKHFAKNLHYDFRLEMDGVLKSWAVPKEPSMDMSVKRLAVAVDDHDLSWGNFEGTIPEGQYGAGKVEIWDHGTYKLVGGSLGAGKLEFDLKGKKLRGKFALVQMKDSKNWLLFRMHA
ncbi:endonuclease III [Candidatus Peregrinibacteria bacterium]|nr:endonuclease III [Candidatus Peregrinibacteria bacterium]